MAFDFKKAAYAAKGFKKPGGFKKFGGDNNNGDETPKFGGTPEGENPMENLKEKMVGKGGEGKGEKEWAGEHEEDEEKIISDLADKFEDLKAQIEKWDDEDLKAAMGDISALIEKLQTEEKEEK